MDPFEKHSTAILQKLREVFPKSDDLTHTSFNLNKDQVHDFIGTKERLVEYGYITKNTQSNTSKYALSEKGLKLFGYFVEATLESAL